MDDRPADMSFDVILHVDFGCCHSIHVILIQAKAQIKVLGNITTRYCDSTIVTSVAHLQNLHPMPLA